MVWFHKYVGRKWDLSYNCWGLVADVYWQEKNIVLPSYKVEVGFNNKKHFASLFSNAQEKTKWYDVDDPETFDLLLFWTSFPVHCGIYDKKHKGVLHSIEKSGVVFQKLREPGMAQWLSIQSLRRK